METQDVSAARICKCKAGSEAATDTLFLGASAEGISFEGGFAGSFAAALGSGEGGGAAEEIEAGAEVEPAGADAAGLEAFTPRGGEDLVSSAFWGSSCETFCEKFDG
jgi:hypothetical protein